MSQHPPLPARWLRSPEAARHAEAIRAILDTPPLVPRNDGLVLFAEIGTARLLPCLVAIKSLHARLGRGRVALLDDGTLIGADRALLAHHCGDPEIVMMPKGARANWAALQTVLERRSGEYWLWLSGDSVTLGAAPEVLGAIALNASFVLPRGGPGGKPQGLEQFRHAAYPGGPDDGDAVGRIESRLDTIDRPGWRYVRAGSGMAGFAAGGPGGRFAEAIRSLFEEIAPGEGLDAAGTVHVAIGLLLASEKRTVVLPHDRYRHDGSPDWSEDTAFLHFDRSDPAAREAHTRASLVAIEALFGD